MLGTALRLLARREHSRAELEQKLRRHLAAQARRANAHNGREPTRRELKDGEPNETGLNDSEREDPSAQIASTLDELARRGWLDERRAAESLVRAKSGRFGTRRLAQLMQQKALPAELVQQSLESARQTEQARALALWQQRFGQAASDPRERARQARFLIGRGFDPSVVGPIVRGGGERAADAIDD